MMSVSLDSGGWTVVTPAADDRVVYVSNSQGDDLKNDGLSPSSPVKTLAKAASLMRSGYGDEMLLNRGDTWHESFGYWTKSGRSASDPMVIGAYGTGDRPTVATGSASALVTGTSSNPTVNHLALMGVRFYADTRDPASPTYTGTAGSEGIRFTSVSDDLLIEDFAIQSYTTNLNFYKNFGTISNVRVRRSLIADSYSTTGNSEGLFAYAVSGLTLDGNVLDHNGWNENIAGAGATVHNHNAYIENNVTGFVARNNLFSNASSHGLQARSGGVIEGNVFLNNPIGLDFGMVNGSPVTAGGVTGTSKQRLRRRGVDRRLGA